VVNLAYRWFCGLSIEDKAPDPGFGVFRTPATSGRPCGLRASCRVLPPALLHRLIVLAGARRRIGRLGVPIALEKDAEAVVAPVVAARATTLARALKRAGRNVDAGLSGFEEMQIEFGRGLVDYGVALGRRWAA
jgi:hypothetical protein